MSGQRSGAGEPGATGRPAHVTSARATGSRSGAVRTSAARTTARGTARPGARAGTSRPAVARVAASRPGVSARARTAVPDHRGSSSWVRGAVLVSILVMLAVTLFPTARSLIRQRGEISALQDKVVQQDQDVSTLTREQERWKDPAYVEQQARERLKFVKVGDKSYSVIDGTTTPPKVPAGAVVAAPSANSGAPWYGQLWQSVRLADQPTAGMAPVPDK